MENVLRSLTLIYLDNGGNVIPEMTVLSKVSAFSNGQTTIRWVMPFSPDDYTVGINAINPDGTVLPTESVDDAGSEMVTYNGVTDEWYRYEYPLTERQTMNSAQNAEGILITNAVITDRNNSSNITNQIPSVVQSVDSSSGAVSKVLPDDAEARLQGSINDRVLKNLAGYLSQDVPVPDDASFYVDLGNGVARKVSMATLSDTVADRSDRFKSYPTLTPTAITDPDRGSGFEGFYNVRALITTVNPPYNPVAQAITIPNVPLVDTIVASTIFSIQDFPVDSYDAGISLNSVVRAKATAGTWILKTNVYKRDSLGVETLLQVGIEESISNTDFENKIITDTITVPFEIEAGDSIALKSVIRATGSGVTAHAEFMGNPETTYTIFNFPSGTISNTKMEKLPLGTAEDLLVLSKDGDGNVKVSTITESDVATKSADLILYQLLSEKGQPLGYVPLNADGEIDLTYLPDGIKTLQGTFGSVGSTTGGDLPSSPLKGWTYICDTNGYASVEAGLTFDNGDFAIYDGASWVKVDNTEAVTSVNNKVGVVVINTKDLPDMPTPGVDTDGDHIVYNETLDTYELSVANNNTSTAVINGMGLSQGVGETFDVSAGIYAYVDYTDPNKPRTTRNTFAGLSNIAITNIATDYVTYVSIDKDMNIIQRTVELTAAQRREECFLGRVGHIDFATVTQIQSTPIVNNQPVNTTRDVNPKPFIEKGILFSGVSLQQQIQHSAGFIVGLGINADNDITSPNVRSLPLDSPVTFTEIWRDGAGGINTAINTVFDPNLYDDGTGTLSTIPNPNNVANHYIYIGTNDEVFIVRGQAFYLTIAAANEAYRNQTDTIAGIPEAILNNVILRSVLSLDKTATDFSDGGDALFYTPQVAVVGAGGGDVGSVDDTNANNTSVLGDLNGKANLKEVNEMQEYKDITFSQHLVPTNPLNADFLANTNTVLKTNQKYRVRFVVTASAALAQLSVDNGVSYKPLVDETLTQFIGTDVSGKTLDLFYNGTQFVLDQNDLALENKTDISLLQNPTIDEETASFTLALDDDGQVLNVNSASAVVVTVPLNSVIAFPIGTQIALYRNGAGTVTLAPTGGVTINSDGGKLAIKSQYSSAALLKTGTDEWLLVGNLEA